MAVLILLVGVISGGLVVYAHYATQQKNEAKSEGAFNLLLLRFDDLERRFDRDEVVR